MSQHSPGNEQDFQRFYYTKVGLGEGCGCAERVIDLFEADRKARESLHVATGPRLSAAKRVQRFLNALGLFRRA